MNYELSVIAKFLKFLFLLFFPLILSACGGGGGGGGSSGEAIGGGAITNCSDTGTAYQTNEYKRMGRGSTSAGYNPLGFVCASSAYARGATGDGIKVGIIDTGVLTGGTTGQSNTTHTDLNDNHATFTSGSDARFNDSTPNDYHGHGTHVAGIVAAEKNNSGMHGVAYDATLYSFRAFNSSGVATTSSVSTSMQNAIDANVDIINNSYYHNDHDNSGLSDNVIYTGSSDCYNASSCENNAIGSQIYTKLEAIGAANIINVWAAGNEGASEPSAIAGSAIYDTDFKETTVVVVAVDTYGDSGGGVSNPILASWSNKCGSAAQICIAAPGNEIYSTSNNGTSSYENMSGTSMAAPMVAGGLALIKQEFSSLTNAQVVDRLFSTANDSGEYSKTSIYGHGMMNLNAATTAVGKLQTINGNNLLDDSSTSYYDLVDNNFISSAAFSNALNNALEGRIMEVYDSFDRANFKTNVSSFFTPGSYTSQNTIENHVLRLKPKTPTNKVKNENLYGSFTMETNGNYIESSIFQSAGNFLTLGFNQSTNSFENAVEPLSDFFNDSNFGNNYLVNPYFNTGSGQDYFMSFNSGSSFGFDSFTNANGKDLGLAFNLNPLSSSEEGIKNAGNLQVVFGANYEQNKFLNSTSSGVFSTGDLSNTNFTGVKYKKNLGDDFIFLGSGFAGYTYIDKAANSYIDDSEPLLTSSFTLGLVKNSFLKEDQNIGFFINQPQRVEDGSINLRVPTSSDRKRTVTYSNYNVDLEPAARQINFDITFNKKITELSNLSANFTHVNNGDHSNLQDSQNFVSIFYKKNF